MDKTSDKVIFRRIWLGCRLLIVALALSLAEGAYGQSCDYLAGATSFAPTKAHASDAFYALSDVVIEGPMENHLSVSSSLAKRVGQFHPDSTFFVYAVTDSAPRLLPGCRLLNRPALVTTLKCDPYTKLFSFTVNNLQPNSTVRISGSLGVLVSGQDKRFSQAGSFSDEKSSRLRIGTSRRMEDLDVPYSQGDVDFDFEYRLGAYETSVVFQVMTSDKFNPGDCIAIYQVKVEGCLKPKVKSSLGLSVCMGEKDLISLNKEYFASSYAWMKSVDGGGNWFLTSTAKNVYEEIENERVMYYCVMDGMTSDTITITPTRCCENEEGNSMSRLTVFYENFGHFVDDHLYVDSKGVEHETSEHWAPMRANTNFSMPDMNAFDPYGQIDEGYGVIVPTVNGFPSTYSWTTWMTGVVTDHSYAIEGFDNSACLFINTEPGFHDVIFSMQVDDLCPNKPFYFETYIANMAANGSAPEITLNIRDAATRAVIGTSTEVAYEGAGWVRVHIDDLELEPGVSSVVLEIVSTGTKDDLHDYSTCTNANSPMRYWLCGNDLAIDDIRFMVCSPPAVDLYSNISSYTGDTVICTNSDFTIGAELSSMLTSFYKSDLNFIYQQSDNGTDWRNISEMLSSKGVVPGNRFSFNTATFPADTNYFRVIAGSSVSLTPLLTDPTLANYDDACRDYSVSKPISIVREGELYLGATAKSSVCMGDGFVLTPPTITKELSTWAWMKDGAIVESTNLDDAVRSYKSVKEDEEVNSYLFLAMTTNGCMGKRKYEVSLRPEDQCEVPRPWVKDTSVCLGETLDLTRLAKAEDEAYELVWYTSATPTGEGVGTPNLTVPSVDTDSLATQTFYVSQRNKYNPSRESSLSELHVTVGQRAPMGSFVIEEAGKREEINIDTEHSEIFSCGGAIRVVANFKDMEMNPITDYTWYKGEQKLHTGSVLLLDENQVTEDQTYRLEYMNGCVTKVELTVHYRPLFVAPVAEPTTVAICPGKPFKTGVKISPLEGGTPSFTWFRNGAEIASLEDVVSTSPLFVVDSVSEMESGRYSVAVERDGCFAKVMLDSLSLLSAVVTPLNVDTIVKRNSDVTLRLDITQPAGGVGVACEWKGASPVASKADSVTLKQVATDQKYMVTLSADGYCSTTAKVNIWVDALLSMKSTLTDYVCGTDTAELVVDTVGTGQMRHFDWQTSLSVWELDGLDRRDVTQQLSWKDGKYHLMVMPTRDLSYEIQYAYGPDTVTDVKRVEVITSNRVVTPIGLAVCEGDTAEIVLTNISPREAVVQWLPDPTLLGAANATTVKVVPLYKRNAEHHSIAAYPFIVSNERCHHTDTMVATVRVDEVLSGELEGEEIVCEGESVLLSAARYGASKHIWISDGDTVSTVASMMLTPTKSVDYKLYMERGLCRATDSISLTLKPKPVVVRVDSVGIRSREVIVKEGSGEEPYLYWADDRTEKSYSPVIDKLTIFTHTAHVEDLNGCRADYIFSIDRQGILIPEYFTPNGDGVNDRWVIDDLVDYYPDAEIKIFHRGGKLLKVMKGADLGWDGYYNGFPAPEDDYWYIINVPEIGEFYTGHFLLIRK